MNLLCKADYKEDESNNTSMIGGWGEDGEVYVDEKVQKCLANYFLS
jgi:hypothetical protein